MSFFYIAHKTDIITYYFQLKNIYSDATGKNISEQIVGDIYHSRPQTFIIQTLVSYILASQGWKLTAPALADILCQMLSSLNQLHAAFCAVLRSHDTYNEIKWSSSTGNHNINTS